MTTTATHNRDTKRLLADMRRCRHGRRFGRIFTAMVILLGALAVATGWLVWSQSEAAFLTVCGLNGICGVLFIIAVIEAVRAGARYGKAVRR